MWSYWPYISNEYGISDGGEVETVPSTFIPGAEFISFINDF